MPARAPLVLIAASLCLLGTQIGGLHVHVGVDGFDATPHAHHVHGAGAPHTESSIPGSEHRAGRSPDAHTHPAAAPHSAVQANHGQRTAGDEHHHAGDRDVFPDLGTGLVKLLPFVVWVALGLLLIAPAVRMAWPCHLVARPKPRHERWRPPLRAPPGLSF